MLNIQTISIEIVITIATIVGGVCWKLFSIVTKIDQKKFDKEDAMRLREEVEERYRLLDAKIESKLDKVDDKIDKIRNSLHDLRNDLQRIAVFSSIKQDQ